MPRILITDGIYAVDFHGTTVSEFSGEHPALIVRTPYEPCLYLVAPLTTYTPERWARLRSRGCKRIPSTNSIARLDKLQILHEREIKGRWIDPSTGAVLLPTKTELENMHNAVLHNFTLMLDKSLRKYEGILKTHDRFGKDCQQLRDAGEAGTSFSRVSGTNDTFAYPHHILRELDIKDIFSVLDAMFGKKNYVFQRGKSGALDVLHLKIEPPWQAAAREAAAKAEEEAKKEADSGKNS